VEAATHERDNALEEAVRARSVAEEAARRLDKVVAERDAAKAALNRASQENVQASEAQLRQAKLDVLKTLANLAVTIKESAAAMDDPGGRPRRARPADHDHHRGAGVHGAT
jgi:uncharacterized protein YukE